MTDQTAQFDASTGEDPFAWAMRQLAQAREASPETDETPDTSPVQPVVCPQCGANAWKQIISTRIDSILEWEWDHYEAHEYGEDTSERAVVAYQCGRCVHRADDATRVQIEACLSEL